MADKSPLYYEDLSLPKAISKNKKINLMVGKYIGSVDEIKQDAFKWDFNKECTRMSLTLEGTLINTFLETTTGLFGKAFMKSILEGAAAEVETASNKMLNGIVAICGIEVPHATINQKPLCTDKDGNALDPEYDEHTVSFNFSLINLPPDSYTMSISLVKLDDISIKFDKETGKIAKSQIKFHPIINSAT